MNYYVIYLLYIWIRKLVLKKFRMLCVLYKRQEREVLKWCGVKKHMLYRWCANVKVDSSVIKWLEPKYFTSRNSTVERPTRIARLRLERKNEKLSTRIHSEVFGTKSN